jgi:hypothetical protein
LSNRSLGYPTIAYEVIADHRKWIYYCSDGHNGARNDKTIVKYNDFIDDLRDHEKGR